MLLLPQTKFKTIPESIILLAIKHKSPMSKPQQQISIKNQRM